jgi:RNA polymerase sigma factor (sigma-70 family)
VGLRSGSGGGRGGLWVRGATDEFLMSRVAGSDDERALSELYDRYGGLIYGVGMRYLGDLTLAEDLVQDVLLSVWRNTAGFDRSRASFATGVYRTTRNRITDLVRRRRARIRIVAPVPEEASVPRFWRRHLAGCAACRNEEHGLRETHERLAGVSIAVSSTPPDLKARILGALPQHGGGRAC